jgi:hypothetical protein
MSVYAISVMKDGIYPIESGTKDMRKVGDVINLIEVNNITDVKLSDGLQLDLSDDIKIQKFNSLNPPSIEQYVSIGQSPLEMIKEQLINLQSKYDALAQKVDLVAATKVSK